MSTTQERPRPPRPVIAALASFLVTLSASGSAEAQECRMNAGDIGHSWAFALPGCPRSVHFDLPVDFYAAKLPGEVRTRFGAEAGFHWAVDDRRHIYVGPVVAVTGGGLSLGRDDRHRFDNGRVAPKVHLRGFLGDFVALEGSLGPVLDLTRAGDAKWYARPGAQLTFGPRVLSVMQLHVGYEWVPPVGPLPSEGRYILGASITLGGALIGGAAAGLLALCAEGAC